MALSLVAALTLAVSGPAAAAKTGGTISGTVTAALGGTPLPGICVSVEQEAGTGTAGGYVATNAKGHYAVSGLVTGSYLVFFSADGTCTGAVVQNYIAQCYDDQPSCSVDTAVSVTTGSKTTGIDASLEAGGVITGTVRAPNGSRLAGICVYAGDTGNTYFGGSATTVANGSYSVRELPSGSFTVHFTAANGPGAGCTGGVNQNYLPQWYSGVSTAGSATPVPVTAGDKTRSIDAVLQRGAKIVGTISAVSSRWTSG